MVIGPIVLIAYALVVCGLALYSLHRGWLLFTYRRLGPAGRSAAQWDGPWPFVTVQLPIFNEKFVVERLIDSVCALDYPVDRLEIQVLDDSSDETAELARRRVAHHAERGVPIAHIQRGARTGYKAGALAYGLERARGEFLLILDADFVPPPDLLRRLLPAFSEPRVGMVQARWGHLNEGASWLTRTQALMLDAHFHIEHGARSAAGLFFNFNGTAGIWRASCIRDAGGWQADTLTEDLDLSYRAQMRGWRFVHRPDVVVPAEVPQTVRAFKNQQARWAQGAIETARKVLPELLRGSWSWRIKLEAVVHLTSYLASPLTLALALLIFPAVIVRFRGGWPLLLLVDLMVLVSIVGPIASYYGEAMRANGRRAWPGVLVHVPLVLVLGIGISVNNTRATLRGLFTHGPSEFVRTPKRGSARARYRARATWVSTVLEAALASYVAVAVGYALANGIYPSVPFLLLFLSGFAAVAVGSLADMPPLSTSQAACSQDPRQASMISMAKNGP